MGSDARRASRPPEPTATRLDRFLSRAGHDRPEIALAKLRWFRRLLLLEIAVEAWIHAADANPPAAYPWPTAALPALHFLCAAAVWRQTWERRATIVAAAVRLAFLVRVFPLTANHVFLECLLLLILASFDGEKADESQVALAGMRWTTIIVVLSSGLQKAAHGFYFHGEFLASDLAYQARALNPLDLFLSARERERLLSLGEPHPGSGSYRIGEMPFLFVSNAIWSGQIGTAIACLAERLRSAAVVGLVSLALAVQLAEREVVFGLLLLNLALLFTRRCWNGLSFVASAAVLAVALASHVGLLPSWYFN